MLFLRLIAIICVISNSYAKIKNCDVKSVIKQRSVSLSPIIKGKDIRLNLDLVSPRQIKDATATYSTRYNYLPAYSYSEAVPQIEHGNFNKTLTYPIPFYAFGNIQVKIRWVSPTQGDLLCLELEEEL
jgi:hypothetical protein